MKILCEFCGKPISKNIEIEIKRRITSKGGKATLKKYGKKYFSRLAKLSVEKRYAKHKPTI